MEVVNIYLEGLNIIKCEPSTVVANNTNNYKIHFHLSEEWEDKSCKAIFCLDTCYTEIDIVDNEVVIPKQILTYKNFTVGVSTSFISESGEEVEWHSCPCNITVRSSCITDFINRDINDFHKHYFDVIRSVKNLESKIEIQGKGLSTNDFTNYYKEKLESLKNYDDTEIKESLDKKQDTLVSGENIKTLNNESILGEGDIYIPTKTSDLVNDNQFVNLAMLNESQSYKVDKVEGKGLSSNDFTNEYKEKLENIPDSGSGSVVTGYEGKIISILGDSISTFKGYIPVADGHNLEHSYRYPDPNIDVQDVNDTWWMKLINNLGAKLGINDSWGGTEVSNTSDVDINVPGNKIGPNTSMATMTRITNLGANGTPDIIFFYGGTNDAGHNRTLGSFDSTKEYREVDLVSNKWSNFADGYKTAIMRLQSLYPDARIIVLTPTWRTNQNPSVAKIDAFNGVIKDICDYFGVEVFDLRRCGIHFQNASTTLGDGLHPTKKGMDLIEKFIRSKLLATYKLNSGENIVYPVTNNLSGVTSNNSYIKGVSSGKSYTATLTANEGRVIDTVTIFMDGKDITSSTYSNGTINIQSVTGDISINATSSLIPTYSITNNLTNISNSNSASSVYKNSQYQATLTAEVGYVLGETTVTMGGVDITSTSYNNGVINISNVTGNIVISSSGIAVETYNITNNLSHISNDNTSSVISEGENYTGTLTADIGYSISFVTVTMGNVDITSTAYDTETGVITINSVSGDIIITATSEAIPIYSITNNLTNVVSDNQSESINQGSSYIAHLSTENAYKISEISVTVDGVDVTSEVYSNNTITINNVTGNIVITASAVEVSIVWYISDHSLRGSYGSLNNVSRGWVSGNTEFNNAVSGKPINAIEFYTNEPITNGVVSISAVPDNRVSKTSAEPRVTTSGTYSKSDTTVSKIRVIFPETITINDGEVLSLCCQESSNFSILYNKDGGEPGGLYSRAPKVVDPNGGDEAWKIHNTSLKYNVGCVNQGEI